MKRKLVKSRSRIVKDLDSAYSKYIRLKDSVGGDATCVTCGVTKPWKELQNGHFYTRGRYPTRWDDMNCHVQCYRCNVVLNGNYIAYTKYMINRYGMEEVDALEVRSLSGAKIPTIVLTQAIEKCNKEVAEMISSREKLSNLPLDRTPWGVV